MVTVQRKHLTRRRFLQATGATLVLLAGGGVYRAVDRGVFTVGQGPAYAPWTDWRDPQPGPLNLVRAAILAANPHNIQPWLFRVSEKQIDVYVDTSRHLGKIDPFLRELFIGVGCAIENLVLAAAANGYATQVTLIPDATDESYAARVDLASGPTTLSPLYEAIPRRSTNRGPYERNRPIDQSILDQFTALNDDPDLRMIWLTSAEAHQQFGDATIEATKAFIADEEQNLDSEAKFRQSRSAIERYRDGLTIDVQPVPDFMKALIKMAPETPPGSGSSTFLRLTADVHVPTAAIFGLMTVPDGRAADQRLRTGRFWQRLHLWATTQGLAMQPISQLLERVDREVELGLTPHFGRIMAELTGEGNGQAIMAFRAGYPTAEMGRSPRRAVEDVLL